SHSTCEPSAMPYRRRSSAGMTVWPRCVTVVRIRILPVATRSFRHSTRFSRSLKDPGPPDIDRIVLVRPATDQISLLTLKPLEAVYLPRRPDEVGDRSWESERPF